jgi:UDP-N-acetylmuramate dehydrogenase
MKLLENISLLPYNSFGIDVNANFFIEYSSVEELQEVLRMDIIKSYPLLQIGGGSNLLFLNDFKGVILHASGKEISHTITPSGQVKIQVEAGVVWDDFVHFCVQNKWYGAENLSLIPGEVGASVVQNIGAYGVEVQDIVNSIDCVEIATGKKQTFTKEECKYGYRDSIFKNEYKGKYIVTKVCFILDQHPFYKINYQHLEEEVLKRGSINLENIRTTIIAIRKSKLPDTKITGNAGSFFMNPVISKSHFYSIQNEYPSIPHYFVSDAHEKLPAGWLIEQCGWKGKSIGKAGVHENQALVLVNLGGATGREILHLAQCIQADVKKKFDIELVPEVNFIH